MKNRNVFQMRSKPNGIDRLNDFIGNNRFDPFISIGWPGIGDLTNLDKDGIRERLNKVYKYEGRQLSTYLGVVNTFVNVVKPGDLVLILNAKGQVYIFEVGEYIYKQEYDNPNDGLCHQREADLLLVIDKNDLNNEMKDLLSNRVTMTQFKYPYDKSGLESLINREQQNIEKIIEKAWMTLEKELNCLDPAIRIKAAGEILKYATTNKINK